MVQRAGLQSCLGRAFLVQFLLADNVCGSYITGRQAAATTSAIDTTATAETSTAATTSSITAISECHKHDTTVYCLAGASEYEVIVPATATGEPPAQYTGCHSHGTELYCIDPEGEDVQVKIDSEEDTSTSESDTGSDADTSSSSSEGQNCHFHAGVEHCVGSSGEDSSSATSCTRQNRDYNMPLRIGLLFVILVTSFIGVAGPIFLAPVLPGKLSVLFTILKQFGTGVILSTAFVHLYTHATLMFTNECLQDIEYEATTSSVVLAGIFLSFLVDWLCHRLSKGLVRQPNQVNDEMINVMVLEAGIVFHSLLIGVTLVVAGDGFFITLFIVILFHQMFEGIALGTRIASLGRRSNPEPTISDAEQTVSHEEKAANPDPPRALNKPAEDVRTPTVTLFKKMLMALTFAIVTPLGMAIGIGVLKQFNGNDPSTLIALGTLDAFSAGILIWVGLVEMLARDWILPNGELTHAGATVTGVAGVGLVSGMVLMSLLGKWA